MQTGLDDTSWWEDLVNAVKPQQTPAQLPTPPALQPPAVNQSAWEKTVEQAKITDSLGTVHDLGLRVFNETQSFSDRPDSNEPIDLAREKLAWSIMNADKKWGFDRQKQASTASPIEPSVQMLNSPAARDAYDSSMKAAREAYLGWKDPTNGAGRIFFPTTPSQENFSPPPHNPPGYRIKTHSGPYNNSYRKGDVPSNTVWISTYEF